MHTKCLYVIFHLRTGLLGQVSVPTYALGPRGFCKTGWRFMSIAPQIFAASSIGNTIMFIGLKVNMASFGSGCWFQSLGLQGYCVNAGADVVDVDVAAKAAKEKDCLLSLAAK